MIQTYSLILWARPHNISLDDMTEIAYAVLLKLSQYGEELAPIYLSQTQYHKLVI
jgi:hypothetical protein